MLQNLFTIETPTDHALVHAYLADFTHHVDWRDDVKESTLDQGKVGADGAIYRQHVATGPGSSWRQVKATVHSDGRRLEYHTLGDAPIRAHGSYQIVPEPNGTSVRCATEIEFTAAGKLLRPIVRNVLERRAKEYRIALTERLNGLAGH